MLYFMSTELVLRKACISPVMTLALLSFGFLPLLIHLSHHHLRHHHHTEKQQQQQQQPHHTHRQLQLVLHLAF